MEDTYNIKSIILRREPFRENDSRTVVYCLEKGRLELVARGTKKIGSKLAGHLEPLTLCNIMAVRGKKFDYIGTAVSDNSFSNIKNNLEKIETAGNIINVFARLVKHNEKDERIFNLLLGVLEFLNKKDKSNFADGINRLLPGIFSLKLLSLLGYRPELYDCVICGKRITPGGSRLDLSKGGLICKAHSSEGLTISDNCIKLLRLTAESDFQKIIKIKVEKKLADESRNIVRSLLEYSH